MNTKQGLSPIIIILIIVLLTGGVFSVYKISGQTKNPSRTASDNLKTDNGKYDTADNWKTYKKEERFYEFRYPNYATISETNSAITDTTVLLKKDWSVTFDITTSHEILLCDSNPYKSISKKTLVSEDKVNKYGNEYRRLTVEDRSAGSSILNEERFYIIKNDMCYMIVNRILDINKIDSKTKSDLEKILSTLKFTK